MVIFGAFLQLFINNSSMLVSFGFSQESYLVSLILFLYLYSISLDIPIRMGLNAFSRYLEY